MKKDILKTLFILSVIMMSNANAADYSLLERVSLLVNARKKVVDTENILRKIKLIDDNSKIPILLKEEDIYIDSANKNNETLLHLSIMKDNEKIAKSLLEYKADPNSQDDDGDTPLHYAIHNSNAKIIKDLLEYKADPNIQNDDGETPLHKALWFDSKNTKGIIELLLDYQAWGDEEDSFGSMPIYHFIDRYNLDLIKLFLKRTHCINIKDRDKNTVLHYIVLNCKDEKAKNIINMIFKEGYHYRDIKNRSNKTPLEIAKSKNLNNSIKIMELNKDKKY